MNGREVAADVIRVRDAIFERHNVPPGSIRTGGLGARASYVVLSGLRSHRDRPLTTRECAGYQDDENGWPAGGDIRVFI